MYLQVNGRNHGGRVMTNYNKNGGRNWIQAFIRKNIFNKDWQHSWWQKDSKLQGKWRQKVGYML